MDAFKRRNSPLLTGVDWPVLKLGNFIDLLTIEQEDMQLSDARYNDTPDIIETIGRAVEDERIECTFKFGKGKRS